MTLKYTPVPQGYSSVIQLKAKNLKNAIVCRSSKIVSTQYVQKPVNQILD